VIRVARNREPRHALKQIATDFGIAESCLRNWLRQADVEDGVKPGTTAADNAELGEAKKRIRLLEQENEVLRRAAAYLWQAILPGMMYPLVRELAGDGIPVTVTCRVLKIARQPFYRWLQSPVTDAELEQAYRANALFDAHQVDPEFGYRFLADETGEAGEPMADAFGARRRHASRHHRAPPEPAADRKSPGDCIQATRAARGDRTWSWSASNRKGRLRSRPTQLGADAGELGHPAFQGWMRRGQPARSVLG
jgi:hypothetical protein